MNTSSNLKPDRKKLLKEIHRFMKFGKSVTAPQLFYIDTTKNEYSVEWSGIKELITSDQYSELKKAFPDTITFRIIPESDQDKFKKENSGEGISGIILIIPEGSEYLGQNIINVDESDLEL